MGIYFPQQQVGKGRYRNISGYQEVDSMMVAVAEVLAVEDVAEVVDAEIIGKTNACVTALKSLI